MSGTDRIVSAYKLGICEKVLCGLATLVVDLNNRSTTHGPFQLIYNKIRD